MIINIVVLLYNSGMQKTFVYIYNGQEYPVIVTYKSIKNIHYRYADGVFKVSCNRLTTMHAIKSGLDKYADWLLKRSEKPKPISEDYIYLFGNKMSLSDDGTIYFLDEIVTYKSKEELLKKLKKPFLKYLADRTACFANIMNAPLYQVKLREMRSRYGSNNCSKKVITYAMMLIHYHPETIDSVVVHELVHCFVYDHSDNFYRLLYKYCPNYDKLRKKLIKAVFD